MRSCTVRTSEIEDLYMTTRSLERDFVKNRSQQGRQNGLYGVIQECEFGEVMASSLLGEHTDKALAQDLKLSGIDFSTL